MIMVACPGLPRQPGYGARWAAAGGRRRLQAKRKPDAAARWVDDQESQRRDRLAGMAVTAPPAGVSRAGAAAGGTSGDGLFAASQLSASALTARVAEGRG